MNKTKEVEIQEILVKNWNRLNDMMTKRMSQLDEINRQRGYDFIYPYQDEQLCEINRMMSQIKETSKRYFRAL